MLRIAGIVLAFLALSAGNPLPAQDRVAPENLGERVIAIVPIIGAGTGQDPKRPLFVPTPEEIRRDPKAFISFTMVVSDDGKSAIVEFTAPDRTTLEPILNARRPDVKVFVRGRHTKQEIEQEARRVRQDFNADQFIKR